MAGAGLASGLHKGMLPMPQAQRAAYPMVISTWDFGLAANAVAMDYLQRGSTALDAVELGVQVSEADPEITSVGRGGFPDAEGDVTLDACIMTGDGQCGAVACLEKTLHPVSVARAVMEQTPHVMLVGQKARRFAQSRGFPKANLLTREAQQAYKEWKSGNPKWRAFSTDISNHDTIGMLAIDQRGHIAGACTTSGWAFKIPGRVGDSPIIGAGLYVDNEVGAATATGTGEEVMRTCGSFLIVELMRTGATPLEACKEAIRRIQKLNPRKPDLFVGFLAINRAGEIGAWSTKEGFEYALYQHGSNDLYKAGF
jgi:N4-(beta-N-acetylglucosaminyl)-L-asparaginase